jgi:LPXTG-site transpeptidase (sortase) family protein
MFFLYRLFAFVGLVLTLVASAHLVQRYNPSRLNFSQPPIHQQSAPSKNYPTRLIIPKTATNLPVIIAREPKVHWDTTDKGVSYLSTSPLPGMIGNTIMYGHNYTNLLAPLTYVRPGDEIIIRSSTGEQITFTVKFVTRVTPDQTNILAPTSDRRLTLYTCSGFLDRERLVVTAIMNEKDNAKANTL